MTPGNYVPLLTHCALLAVHFTNVLCKEVKGIIYKTFRTRASSVCLRHLMFIDVGWELGNGIGH